MMSSAIFYGYRPSNGPEEIFMMIASGALSSVMPIVITFMIGCSQPKKVDPEKLERQLEKSEIRRRQLSNMVRFSVTEKEMSEELIKTEVAGEQSVTSFTYVVVVSHMLMGERRKNYS